MLVEPAAGATLGTPYATAYQALFHRALARPGQRLLVRGASGGVGLAAVQLGVAYGLEVTGTAGTEVGRELVRQQKAHQVCGHDQTEGPYDVILEMLANLNLDRDFDEAALRATIVVIGNRGQTPIDARKTMTRELTVKGMSLVNATPDELSSLHHALYAGLSAGFLKPVVRSRTPLSQAAEAHRLVLEPGAAGNLILEP